jgi:predicted ester cyclase
LEVAFLSPKTGEGYLLLFYYHRGTKNSQSHLRPKTTIMKKLFFLIAASLGILIAAIKLTSCNSDKTESKEVSTGEKMDKSTEDKEERNKQTALSSINAVIAGDVDGALKSLAPDATDYMDGSMPPIKGTDSITANLKMWRSALSEYKGDNLLAVADGDRVVVFGDWSGTFKTDFMGMKTAGKSFKVNDADIFKFNEDGKITEHRSIQSGCAMMSQLK